MTTQRSSCWSVTINNPTPSDEEAIQLARQKGWKVEGQLEKGEGGTLHYQLAVRTPQVRFSALKRQFPRAHIEVARNAAALSQYVTKEETRQQSLPQSQEMYPSLSKLWNLIYEYICDNAPTLVDNTQRLYIPSRMDKLTIFDEAIKHLIERGYHVESMGVNPQVRTAWKLYSHALFARSHAATTQTDRQTDIRLESEVNIPVIEHNNADDQDDYDSQDDHS